MTLRSGTLPAAQVLLGRVSDLLVSGDTPERLGALETIDQMIDEESEDAAQLDEYLKARLMPVLLVNDGGLLAHDTCTSDASTGSAADRSERCKH